MWRRSDRPRPRWERNTQLVLTTGFVLAGIYLAVVFIGRALQPTGPPAPKLPVRRLNPDYYVYPPRSYVRSLADVQAWVGKPLWVREGYRRVCSPGGETPGPLERLAPVRAFERGGNVWLEFDRNGRPCAIQVSGGDTFVLDEIFLIQDPREIYTHWSAQTWRKIAAREIEPGMTETQITFAIGYGVLNRALSQPGSDAWRVVEYTGGDIHVRVSYEYGVARRIWPLP